jgi:hypothetical protein
MSLTQPLLILTTLILAVSGRLCALEQSIPALPAPTGTVVTIASGDVNGLISACGSIHSNTTIVISAGTYHLGGNHIELDGGVSNIALRGATGVRSDVVIDGGGMLAAGDNSVSAFAIEIDNAQNVTIADLSIGDVYYSALQLDGGSGCQQVLCHDVRFFDTGEQLLKSNPTTDPGTGFATGGVNNSTVEYCRFEYTTTGPTSYTNGIDVHHGANWHVMCNQFVNMGGPGGAGEAGPAILFWNGCTNPLVERNWLFNCQRGIFFGLQQRQPTGASFTDCAGGIIRNNMIDINNPNYDDAPIGIWDCPSTQVVGNTCIGVNYMDSIEYRFSTSTGEVIENNLTNSAILSRDGASGTVSNNVTSAQNAWFANAATGDLHLGSSATSAFFAGIFPLASCTNDWDGNARPTATAPDVGAHQYHAVAGGTSGSSSTTTSGTGSTGGSTTTSSTGSGTGTSTAAGSGSASSSATSGGASATAGATAPAGSGGGSGGCGVGGTLGALLTIALALVRGSSRRRSS